MTAWLSGNGIAHNRKAILYQPWLAEMVDRSSGLEVQFSLLC